MAPCFYHEWIYPLFLARVDEDAVLSDSAHSGITAEAAVVPVALHRPWVHFDSEALMLWSSEIRQDLFWWWAHELFELVSSLGRVSPMLTCGPTLQIQTIRASVVRSPYRNPVRLPFIFLKLVRLERAARIILAGDSQCFRFFSALLAQLQDDGFHPSIPSLFNRSICHSLRLWLLRLRSRLLCLSMCLLNGASQSWPALCLL